MKGKDQLLFLWLFITVVVAALASWGLWLGHKRWLAETRAKPSLFPQYSVEELKRAHEHHGIWCSKQDEKGEWYFMRDGKKCKLFAYSETE